MKITQIMFSEGWGGAERLFVELCSSLAQEGILIQAIVRTGFVRRHALENIPGLEMAMVRASGNWDFLAATKVGRLVAHFQPDLIHTHLSRATWMGGKAGKTHNIPTLATTHNRIKLKYCRNIQWFSTITLDLAEYLEQNCIDPLRIRTIPNFSTFEPVLLPPPMVRRSPVFVSFGRFVNKKGFRVLLEAFRKFIDLKGNTKLLLAGSGPLEEDLREWARALGLDSHIKFPGWVENIAALLDGADIFVLPSLDEPFGIVLLEAMARGKPVVTTRTSGPMEVLDESSAYFADTGDAGSLCAAMVRAAADEEGRIARAVKALDAFNTLYTRAAVVEQFKNLYEDVINDKMKNG